MPSVSTLPLSGYVRGRGPGAYTDDPKLSAPHRPRINNGARASKFNCVTVVSKFRSKMEPETYHQKCGSDLVSWSSDDTNRLQQQPRAVEPEQGRLSR